ncbi:MAG: NAD-dependent epimerase/dehydratase family protein [Candidatus Kuenenia stuttgartiensis]|nr:NAD-dependent epimerase/dehydratase family protein [Candidatus Kuenenia stuttgartiensis]
MSTELHAVTGAFGFSGRYIARNLLDRGRNVITLTNSLHRPNPFGESVKAYPFNFDKPEKLTESLSGVSVLYNTYWVRFNYKTFGYSTAIQNTFALFEAAKKAGVKRIVHTSITNPSESSPYEYFRDKAIIEKNLIESGISYAILRPAVLFGKEGILINNIAWALRKFPFFSIFGEGNYRLQPIYVNDFATLAVEQGEKSENTIINAIGPETFSYRDLVTEIGNIIGKKRPFVSVSPFTGYCLALIIGKFVHDVLITKDEIEGLMDDLLYVDAPPAGNTKLTEWARENASILGKQYESELARRRIK